MNRLENVTIDASNQAFGGYIYSVSYSVGVGGDKTTLKVRLINATGDYFISKEDLKTNGAPTEIKIGSRVTFYGYPTTYRFEKSGAGKILEVEYDDESIAYLDQRAVALTGRIANPPANIIVLGRRFIRKYAMGANLQLELASENEQYLNLEDLLRVPIVQYTFPELLTAINDIVGTVPVLTDDHENFYREYTGTLREVLSSWCGDLGLTFYWQERKLRFIDLRNPETFTVIKSRIDSIISGVKPESVDETVTLRDTFVRANTSLFLRDGSIYSDNSNGTEITRRLRFNPFRVNDVPQVRQYYGATSLLSEPHISRMKAAKFGPESIILSLLDSTTTTSYRYFPDQQDIASIAVRRLNPSASGGSPSDTTMYNFIKTEADDYFGASQSYTVFIVYTRDNAQLSDDYTYAFKKLTALAEFMGRYYYRRMNLREFQESSFDKDVKWFYDGAQFASTPLGQVLEPFSNIITNFQTVSIRGFINGNSNDTTFGDFFGEDPLGISDGYAIAEITPQWSPQSLAQLFNKENVFIYEPKSDSTSLIPGTFFIASVGDFSGFSFSEIQEPDEGGLDVYTTTKRNAIISGDTIDPKTELCATDYPEDFETAQISRREVNTIDLPEELILAQAPTNELEQLTSANFAAAHNAYTTPLAFSQTEPFFTKTFSLPYVDLPVDPKVEDGFQSLDISYAADGLTATYTYGTSEFKLPNPDFYLATEYKARENRALPLLKPKIVINFRGANRVQ